MYRSDLPRAIERIAHAGRLLTARGERAWQICAEHSYGPSTGSGPSSKGEISDPTANAALGPPVDDRIGDLRHALRNAATLCRWIVPGRGGDALAPAEAANLPWYAELFATTAQHIAVNVDGLVRAQVVDVGHAAHACDQITAIIERVPAVDARWCHWCWADGRYRAPSARGRNIKSQPACGWHVQFRARHQRMPSATEIDAHAQGRRIAS
jgi:hypothetical protein